MSQADTPLGESIVQWGVRVDDGRIIELSEAEARHEVAVSPEVFTLVHRVVTFGPWATDQPDVCRHGHPRTGANTYVTPDGRRNCRRCRSANSIRSKRKMRAERRKQAA